MVLIRYGGSGMKTARVSFRPLAGIMVLIVNSKNSKPAVNRFKFPSPCGDYGSYLYNVNKLEMYVKKNVSVPLRGLWFLSSHYSFNNSTGYRFPSPCGDYGSYLDLCAHALLTRELGFRPLAGIMVLIKHGPATVNATQQQVSVPLRGLWFLSCQHYMMVTGLSAWVSVPLRGLWFLSARKKLRIDHNSRAVSVPLRGLWFLSMHRNGNH